MEYSLEDKVYVARGQIVSEPQNEKCGFIQLDDEAIEIPELLFLFWMQFQTPYSCVKAKAEFIAAGLNEELWDDVTGALLDAGLLEIVHG